MTAWCTVMNHISLFQLQYYSPPVIITLWMHDPSTWSHLVQCSKKTICIIFQLKITLAPDQYLMEIQFSILYAVCFHLFVWIIMYDVIRDDNVLLNLPLVEILILIRQKTHLKCSKTSVKHLGIINTHCDMIVILKLLILLYGNSTNYFIQNNRVQIKVQTFSKDIHSHVQIYMFEGILLQHHALP